MNYSLAPQNPFEICKKKWIYIGNMIYSSHLVNNTEWNECTSASNLQYIPYKIQML